MNAELSEEISGLMSQVRTQARREQALRRELRTLRQDDPQSADIHHVFAEWQRLLGHPGAKMPTDGSRWPVIRRALRSHTVQECIEALEGLALKPYVVNGKRMPSGPAAKRYDDVDHALGDEKRIDQCRRIRARAYGADVHVLRRFYLEAQATANAFFDLVMFKLGYRSEDKIDRQLARETGATGGEQRS